MDVLNPKNIWPFSWFSDMIWKYRYWSAERKAKKARES